MNAFELAYKQLEREGLLNKLSPGEEFSKMIDRAIIIRNWLIKQRTMEKIAQSRWDTIGIKVFCR